MIGARELLAKTGGRPAELDVSGGADHQIARPDEARIDPRGAAGDRAVAAARGRRQHRIAEKKDIGRIDLKAAGGGIDGAAPAPRSAALAASRLSADARIGTAEGRARECQYV